VIDHKAYATREAFEAALDGYLRSMQVEIVALAGFMRVLTASFISGWEGRMMNIHPSLLPAFPGLESWKQALDAGVSETGATVHFVDDGMDTGPVILQERVPVLPGDTAESLHARIQVAEHRLYPAAIELAAARLAER